ncbi:oxidation resistance protein 1 [Lingula anatina]|uniref:Oxidation resistance protein 1 n=1 Tax=Lingula anatina TaxID=7574 RepID=A0A2R2MR74_LINAN|nr:oxidation resistance protein 1 [Lingula anatina]|eukprot:XP_023932512.1 oxidation resistance protein 1 [Lingula anatina]
MEGEPGPADVTTLRKFVRERSNSFRDWWRSKRAPHLREGGKSKSEDGFKQTASTGNMASQSEPGGGGGGIFSIGGTASSPPPWTSLSEEVKRKLDEIENKPRSMTEMVTDPGDAGNGKKKGRQVVQPKGTIVYEVRDRDSLTSIAAKFDTTPSVLVKINRLVTRVVFPGQNIFVPDKDYVPSEPTSPVESPTSSATSNPLKIAVGRVEPDLHTPLRSPGHAERVFPSSPPQEVHEIEPPKPLSEDEAKKLDEECYERFIKLNVRYITDGQGVVKGVLLVTPNAVMFDPDVSDPLVQENSPEMYGMIAPMDMIISAAMYHDISIMKLKGEAVGMKPSAKVYHAPDCAIHRADQSESEAAEVTPPTSQSEPITEEDIADAKIKEKRDRFKRARTVSACSCGAERIVSEALEKVRRSSIDHAGISPKVHDGHSHNDKNEDGDGKNLVQITTVMSTEDKSTGSVTGSNVGASEAATTQSDSSVISQDSKTKMSDVAKANDSADFDPLQSSNSLEQEVHLSDINEVPLVKQKDIPHHHHHHHHVGPHVTDHNPVAPPDDPIPEVSEAEDIPLEQLVKDDHELSFHSEKDNGDDVDDDFTDSLQKEDGLTYPLEGKMNECAESDPENVLFSLGSSADSGGGMPTNQLDFSPSPQRKLSNILYYVHDNELREKGTQIRSRSNNVGQGEGQLGDYSISAPSDNVKNGGDAIHDNCGICDYLPKTDTAYSVLELLDPDNPAAPISQSPDKQPAIFGSWVSLSSNPNLSTFVDFSSGMFSSSKQDRGRVQDVHDLEEHVPQNYEQRDSSCDGFVRKTANTLWYQRPPTDTETHSGEANRGFGSSGRFKKGYQRSSSGVDIEVESLVKVEDRPELFKSIDGKWSVWLPRGTGLKCTVFVKGLMSCFVDLKFIFVYVLYFCFPIPTNSIPDLLFKCASPTSLDEPPLYLCLKVGIPINKPVSKTCPIESYSKKKKKPEYWFAIPRDKVDHLYAFFIQWSPNIYGDESDIDPQERGFVMIGEDEEEEELALEEEHFVTPSKRIPRRLTRVVSKDWEVVSMDEARRRLEALEVEDMLPLPELIGKSAILEEEHIKALNKKLPPRAEGYPWTQVYSTEQHGFSLHTLYRLMQGLDNPVMIVIKDTDEQIFGALTSDPIKVSDHFYGTGETFLFTFYEEFKTYNWTGENTFFVKGNQHSLAIGAGEGLFGLWLDEDFYHGRTHFCQTFGNEPLTIKEDFVVKNVEVWAFLFDWR